MSSRTEEVRRQGESDALVAVSQKRRSLIPAVYRRLLSDAQTRRLLLGLGVSALGDGMSTLRNRNIRRVTLLIVAGWGACLLPFVFAPVGVTLVCFALGGLIYGPFIPLTYALFQSSTTGAHLPTMLAARSAIIMVATPLGTAIGGPLVGTLGAAQTLTASGAATVLLAVTTGIIWIHKRQPNTNIPGR